MFRSLLNLRMYSTCIADHAKYLIRRSDKAEVKGIRDLIEKYYMPEVPNTFQHTHELMNELIGVYNKPSSRALLVAVAKDKIVNEDNEEVKAKDVTVNEDNEEVKAKDATVNEDDEKVIEKDELLGAIQLKLNINAAAEVYKDKRKLPKKKSVWPIDCHSYNDAYIQKLVVSPKLRNHGVGTNLYRHAIEFSKNASIHRLFAHIGEYNTFSWRAASSAGFELVSLDRKQKFFEMVVGIKLVERKPKRTRGKRAKP